MNDIWNARRIKLEEAVKKASLDLFDHTGSGAFKLSIKDTSPEVFIVAGDVSAINSLFSQSATPLICEGCGGEINPDYGKCRKCE